jgi:aminomethyltransferase
MAKHTPFYSQHIRHGARMAYFAGYQMPMQYEGILAETSRVRSTVGLFDVSHMGEIEISGPDARTYVNWVTINDPRRLDVYQVQYSAFCYHKGGIVDDILVYRLPDRYLLVVNASNIDKDYLWLVENRSGEVDIINKSDEIGQLAIQGPKSLAVVEQLTDAKVADLSYYTALEGEFCGVPALISRTGYTGEDGFEIYIEASQAEGIWDRVMEAGSSYGIAPVGLGARDLLRLEMGYCLYGNDIDETTTPLEGRLGWITKLDKGEFIGREALVQQKEGGLRRRLVGFEMVGRPMPRQHYPIRKDGRRIGEVTSGSFSPSVGKGIGMGYIEVPYNKKGTEIQIAIRDSDEQAVVVVPPFYKGAAHSKL